MKIIWKTISNMINVTEFISFNWPNILANSKEITNDLNV